MGLGVLLVKQTIQGTAARDVQRERRDGGDPTVLSFDHWLSGDMGVDALLEWSEQHGKLADIAQALGIKAAR